MKHYDENLRISFDVLCNHPHVRNNTCPTGYGNCVECNSCVVKMTAEDFYKLYSKYYELKNTK